MMDILKNIDWSTIFSNAVIFGLLIWAAIKFFSKSFIKSLGEKTAELLTTKQKTLIEETVKSTFATELEKFKSDLQKTNIAYQVNYSFFNTERSKACIELYKKLYKFNINAGRCIDLANPSIRYGDGSTFETQYLQYEQSLDELIDCYYRSQIFLDDDVCDQIIDFINNVNRYCSTTKDFFHQIEDEEKRKHVLKESKIREEMDLLFSNDFVKIVDSFRKLIQPEKQ